MRPLISYNFGAKHFKRVIDIIKVSIAVISIILCSGSVLFLFFQILSYHGLMLLNHYWKLVLLG